MSKRLLTTLFFITTLLPASWSLASIATTRMAIIGDSGDAGPAMDQLQNSILAANIKSLILPGDNLYSGTYESTWDNWKRTGLLFDVVAIGNHHDGYDNEVRYFSMPGEYYSKVIDGARFIVLNSDNQSNVAEQMSWLSAELAAATERLIFLVYHHPSYTLHPSHQWTERRAFQIEMRKFLKQYSSKITAVLVGHDHISTFVEFGKVPVIVAGAGRRARPATAVDYIEDGTRILSRFVSRDFTAWAKLEYSPSDSTAKVTFIRVRDQKEICTAFVAAEKFELDPSCPQW